MTPEELLNEQKREFVRLNLEVKRLKAAGRLDKANATEKCLRELGRAIVAGNQAQDIAKASKQRKPVEYGVPSFKKRASSKKELKAKDKQ